MKTNTVMKTKCSNLFTICVRVVTSPSFSPDKILGAILFEQTMDREVEGKYTGDYLADKGVVPFLKVDKGLAEEKWRTINETY